MNRRRFIKGSLVTSLVLATGGGYFLFGGRRPDPAHLTSAYLLELVEHMQARVARGSAMANTGLWQPAQIFTHCAQSIEYSMDGYPEHYSTAFKSTVGSAALAIFLARNRMSHDLDEGIPGAPPLDNQATQLESLERLAKSIRRFQFHQQSFAPHFAYGELSKAEYELAHVMHFHNHMEEIKALDEEAPNVV